MKNDTDTRQTGRARGRLMWLEQDLRRGEARLAGVSRNRIIGGVVLLISVLALIGFLVGGGQFFAFVAAAGLLIGALVFIVAQTNMGGARRSVHATTDDITGARADLTELEDQSPPRK